MSGGPLDQLVEALNDPEIVERLLEYIMTPDMMRLLDNLPTLIRLASKLSEEEAAEALGKLISLVVELNRRGLLDRLAALLEKVEPEKIERLVETLEAPAEPAGMLDLAKALKNPEIRRGMGLLLRVLSVLGEASRSTGSKL